MIKMLNALWNSDFAPREHSLASGLATAFAVTGLQVSGVSLSGLFESTTTVIDGIVIAATLSAGGQLATVI